MPTGSKIADMCFFPSKAQVTRTLGFPTIISSSELACPRQKADKAQEENRSKTWRGQAAGNVSGPGKGPDEGSRSLAPLLGRTMLQGLGRPVRMHCATLPGLACQQEVRRKTPENML